ncbi:MAG: NTP transferase domain-containing protein, partial [Christensenellales bacterium]
MKRTRIGCVLMAAGSSSRFGGNKLLADFFGKTLIERAMEAVPRDKLLRTAVVSGCDEALSMALDFDFLTVRNDRPEDGVSRTIRLGLDALGDVDAAMFMVADQPCLSRW